METIETRLRRLERQNRIYRNLFILAGLALVAAVSYGAAEPVPDLIQARKFQVLSNAGKIAVEIASNPDGQISIFANEEIRARLGGNVVSGFLRLTGKFFTNKADHIYIAADGISVRTLENGREKNLINIVAEKTGGLIQASRIELIGLRGDVIGELVGNCRLGFVCAVLGK